MFHEAGRLARKQQTRQFVATLRLHPAASLAQALPDLRAAAAAIEAKEIQQIDAGLAHIVALAKELVTGFADRAARYEDIAKRWAKCTGQYQQIARFASGAVAKRHRAKSRDCHKQALASRATARHCREMAAAAFELSALASRADPRDHKTALTLNEMARHIVVDYRKALG
jgi:hypothetical protein